MILNVKNLTKKFGNNSAVEKVSLTINSGEIFSLIGPNGSGKTTIIKLVSGLLKPTAGTIEVDGNDVVKNPISTKSVIGYIPDDPSIWSGMTGEEFLHFSGALYGLDEKTRINKIDSWLKVFNLSGIEKDYFESYSRGNKQKFTIIAAMMHEPKLLLIDEPIVGLDPGSAEIAKEKFAEFAKNGGAVFLVTHTLSVAEAIADRIGILKVGKIVGSGTISELRKKENLPDNTSLDKIYQAFTK